MLNNYCHRTFQSIFVFLLLFFAISGCANNGNNKLAHQGVTRSNKPADLVGIYAVMPNKPISEAKYQSFLSNPNIDGFYIQADWRDVEANPGVYNWELLDTKIKRMEKAGKKVTVAVVAGSAAPDWLWDKGAKYLETKIDAVRQQSFCADVKVPLPWDAIYLEAWGNFVKAFGTRYDKHPAVSSVKLSGVSYRTSETILPRSTSKMKKSRTGSICNLPDDVENWRKVGYTSTKVIDAFSSITQSFVKAFPTKPLVMMTDNNAFPPIGANGEIDPSATSLSTGIFLKIGTELAGERFIGQSNALTAYKSSQGIKAFGESGHTVGYQAAWYLSGDPDCHMSNGQKAKIIRNQCNQDVNAMQKVIDQAIEGKARYIELMPVDILNPEFADVIAKAHRHFNSF
jgi:Beta-galactosidase